MTLACRTHRPAEPKGDRYDGVYNATLQKPRNNSVGDGSEKGNALVQGDALPMKDADGIAQAPPTLCG